MHVAALMRAGQSADGAELGDADVLEVSPLGLETWTPCCGGT
jgi:hypothetical protein